MTEFSRSHELHELIIEEALLEPIPLMDDLRTRKTEYRQLPIDLDSDNIKERLVNIHAMGLAGQGYYSRPNAATGEPVPGAPANLYLRRSIAQSLAVINRSLTHPSITEFFGGQVELYIEDALRPYWLQKQLRHVIFPEFIRRQHPNISDRALQKELDKYIAKPAEFDDLHHPTPHRTGAAFDLTIRYKQATRFYVPNTQIERGEGNVSEKVWPDYYELHKPTSVKAKLAQKNRRALYSIFSGKVFGAKKALFYVNPHEIFHWGNGDPLSAWLAGEKTARYSVPPDEESATKSIAKIH